MAGKNNRKLDRRQSTYDILAQEIDGDAKFTEIKSHFKDLIPKEMCEMYDGLDNMYELLKTLRCVFKEDIDRMDEEMERACEKIELHVHHGKIDMKSIIRQMSLEEKKERKETKIRGQYGDRQFVGRREVIDDVIHHIDVSEQDVCLYGSSGIGKTSTVAEICLLLKQMHNWDIKRVDLNHRTDYISSLKEVTRVFGYGYHAESGESELEAYIQKGIKLVRQRTLLLVDNTDSWNNPCSNSHVDDLMCFLKKLVPIDGKIVRLLVTKCGKSKQGYFDVSLGPLAEDKCRDLFQGCLEQNQHVPIELNIARCPLSIRILASTIAYLNIEDSCIVQKLEAFKKENSERIELNTKCVQFAFELLAGTDVQKNLIKLVVFGTAQFSKREMSVILGEGKSFQLDGPIRCHFIEKNNRWNFQINKEFRTESGETKYCFHPIVLTILENFSKESFFQPELETGKVRFIQLYADKVDALGKQLHGASFMKSMTILNENQQNFISFIHCFRVDDSNQSNTKRRPVGDIKACIYRKEVIQLIFNLSYRIKVTEDISRASKRMGEYFDSFMWKKEVCELYISESRVSDAIKILGDLEIDDIMQVKSKKKEFALAGLFTTKGKLAIKQGDDDRAESMLEQSKELYELYQNSIVRPKNTGVKIKL
ncbi:hypothetical protein ScPMuIL_012286 [Solemya velum]